MQVEQLTAFLIRELHRLVDANQQTRSVLKAMREKATDRILEATIARFLEINEEEGRLLQWLLAEQGEEGSSTPSRPVQVIAHDGWLATGEVNPKIRDLSIASVTTQLQSYHLATWFGVGAWLRVLQLHAEADIVDQGTRALRQVEREIETLRPTLAQLDDNPDNSSDRYKPSNRRHFGNFSTPGLSV